MSEKKLIEKLTYDSRNAAKSMSAERKKSAYSFAESYKAFLDEAKMEREAVRYAEKIAKENGFLPFEYGKRYAAGDKIYYNNRGKAIILTKIGTESPENGFGIIAAHIDSPRVDLKPDPLCEKDEIAYFKTHYYGGIKKYQWPTIPLALHGRVVKANGETVDFSLGEKDDDPIFYITDLLPHLGQEQMTKKASEAVNGENGLCVLAGSVPLEGEDKDAVKLNVLKYLNEEYGIVEEDFLSSELTLLPAMKARDVGFDRSLVASYGHDDRVCAYPALKAVLDVKDPKFTAVCVLTDKEEIGSEGNTGLITHYLYDFLCELCGESNARRALSNSWCLSADVNACFDPNYAEAFEKQNASLLHHGVVITKYTGSHGKSGTSDASAEFMGKIRSILNENDVFWQIGELGKVDFGGGGTVAKYIARLNIDVVDLGVPVLSMHAPYEVISKFDLFSTYEACRAFFSRK